MKFTSFKKILSSKKFRLLFYPIGFLSIISLLLTIEGGLLLLDLKKSKQAGEKLATDIINNKQENFNSNFENWQKQTAKLNKKFTKVKLVSKFLPEKYQALVKQVDDLFALVADFNTYLPQIVGQNNQKTYFILLQNNLELRPSGGFMGSYAKIKFVKGGMKELNIQDIYVPDGQISGHVQPPEPIQQAFKQGWWRLRDSNWEPDFPSAAEQILWFFEKGKEEKADGLFALNLLTLKELLKIVQPLNLPDYDYQITADNFYQTAQNEAEKQFFPGSTQKKDFLSSLAKQLVFELQNINSQQTVQLIKIVKKQLEEKQILISFTDPYLAQFVDQLNWNGAIEKEAENKQNSITDYFYLVETNLGANKANCCLQRKVSQEIELTNNGLVKEKATITYFNTSPKERPKPPLFWGGVYENYLRIILPSEVEISKIQVNQQNLKKEQITIQNYSQKMLKSVGFFVVTQPLDQSKVEIYYWKKGEIGKNKNYCLKIQKQPGIEKYSHLIKLTFPEQFNLQTNLSGNLNKNSFLRELEIKKDRLINFSF